MNSLSSGAILRHHLNPKVGLSGGDVYGGVGSDRQRHTERVTRRAGDWTAGGVQAGSGGASEVSLPEPASKNRTILEDLEVAEDGSRDIRHANRSANPNVAHA